jgi:hypothetical protein
MRVILSVFLLTSVLFGHKLYILADDDGKSLHVKSYFTKSSTCKSCEVKIYKAKKLLDSGKTDDMKNKNIEIEVIASMGHKNSISYSSENEIITEDKNITAQKMFMALGIIALIFFLLRVFKK